MAGSPVGREQAGDDTSLPVERRLSRLIGNLEAYRRLQSQKGQLGVAVLRILWLLSDDRPRTMKELERGLSLEQSTVNRQVNASVAEGLLEKGRRPGVSAYEFRRTEAGRDAFEREVTVIVGPVRATVDALGPERTELFLGLLAEFVEAYGDAV